MIGGYYDEHRWLTFDAPIIVEDPSFPGMQQFPPSFVLRDEIYQMKNYSRNKVRVLMRLDVSKVDMKNKNVTAPMAISRSPGQDVRQGPCLLHVAGPRGSELG